MIMATCLIFKLMVLTMYHYFGLVQVTNGGQIQITVSRLWYSVKVTVINVKCSSLNALHNLSIFVIDVFTNENLSEQ